MEVRDVFAMRKEGRWEEAYRAIMQLYAVHQGPHTNLCMFWCTNDLFKLRAKQKRTEEARRLLFQLVKLYPLFHALLQPHDGGRLAAVHRQRA